MTKAMQRYAIMGVGLLALGGCEVPRPEQSRPVVSVDAPAKSDEWKRVASEADEDRIARLLSAWSAGLAEAKAKNFVTAITEEGVLLQPDSALDRPAPTPGSYSCRLIKIGSPMRGKPGVEKFKPFFCYVDLEEDLFTIVKQTGSKRPAGRLWEDDDPRRLIFLGSLALGNEDEARAYGEDPNRDMAGVFQRVAPFRWRLVIPWPKDGGKVDVFELTPVANQPQ